MSFVSKLITPQAKRKIRKFFSFRYKGMLEKDFTIFSNNCWGGIQYDRLGKQYTSPTIGTLLTPSSYIKFLENLDKYLACECVLDESLQRKDGDHLGLYKAHLSDIDLFFIHYSSGIDGVNKWNRRKSRICLNNVIAKWSDCTIDGDFVTDELIERFSKLPFKKIFFTTNKELASKHDFAIYVKTKDNRDNFLEPDFELNLTKNVIRMKKLCELINR